MSHRRQLSGLISSARMTRAKSFSQIRPNSILKSTRVMPTAPNMPDRKSFTRRVMAIMSSISWVEAQLKAVMCSSVTIGSLSLSFL